MANEGQHKADNEGLDEEVTAAAGNETAAEPSAAAEAPADAEAGLEAAAEETAEDIAEAVVTLEQLQEELDAARDASLRAQAEAQNARRRAEQDVEKARKFALERFAGELLPVVDNLERALLASVEAGDSSKAVVEGVELTLKSMLDVLRKHNIEQIDPAGEPFDPQLHQAMSMVENADVEPNSVLHVMQKGYTLSGRLIRPAMVMVSKAPE